jgi:type IV secretory pathway VirJ component
MIAGCASNAKSAVPVTSRRSSPAPVEVFNYGHFRDVGVFRGRARVRDVVLFISGDGGWTQGTSLLAQRLADKGAVVAGIDFRRYREELEKSTDTCLAPASDLENLSHYLQSKLQLSKYLEPTLVGFGPGAALAYATLAQSPEGLFKSVLTIGFRPSLDIPTALCKSAGFETTLQVDAKGVSQGSVFAPTKILPGKWVALQGELDEAYPLTEVRKFVESVPGSQLITLPGVGPEYGISHDWMPQYDSAYALLAPPRSEAKSSVLPAAVADLPLVIVPVPLGAPGDWFGVFLTGDGGWVGLDKGISAELAKHNIPVVGWDSLKYFWSRRTPDGAAHDLDRVLRTYSHEWGRSRALLIGYSQGADTMPFMVNRLPPETRQLVAFTSLLGISDNAVWEFHVASWLGSPAKGIPTGPELQRWSGSPYLCLYGESDGDSACAALTGHDGRVLKLPGGHHFDGDYAEVADEILSRLPGS